MRDGSSLPPNQPSFDELAAFARSVIAGHEPHSGAQIQLLTLAEGYLRLYEKPLNAVEPQPPIKPKPIPLSRERGNNPYPEERPL